MSENTTPLSPPAEKSTVEVKPLPLPSRRLACTIRALDGSGNITLMGRAEIEHVSQALQNLLFGQEGEKTDG